MAKLKPDFIATARAARSQTDRMFAALMHGKSIRLIQIRRNRLFRLYASQIKTPA